MKRTLAIAIATALGAMGSPAEAVMLNPRGTGQVLIYPYYTVNHQQTLVSVINTTAHGKALKVRFREGYDGRDVANFNVYLGPYDSWVGSVFDTSSDSTGAAAIATNDNSCTVPAFPLASVPGTLHALTFSNANYSQGDYGTPTGTDHGPTNLARTREGFFEVIEMGEVVDQSTGSPKTLEAITPVNGKPPACAQVQNAWASGGYWTTNATTDLLPPAGGVYGASGIVDVTQGTLYAFNAIAIDGFSDIVQHAAPNNAKPNLSTAVTDSARDIATAYVPIGNAMIKADYPASTRGVDAVSAVLMTDTLYNEYDVDPRLGAASDWLITLPTKQYYVDPAIVGSASNSFLAPFQQVFGGDGFTPDPGNSCFQLRDGHQFDREGTGLIEFSSPPPFFICNETLVLSFGHAKGDVESPVSGALQSKLWGAGVPDPDYEPPFASGHASWRFLSLGLRPSTSGNSFGGQPAIGFLAVNYINANVTPGVLSNYSAVYPHRSSASCTNSTNPQSACQ
jgi:hypothetical protein